MENEKRSRWIWVRSPRNRSLGEWCRDAVVLFGIGIICLPILLLLLPNIESSRTEARIAMAYIEARRLRDSAVADAQAEPITLPDRDPWGEPYRAVTLKDHSIQILSSGPNQVFEVDGIDGDDIYSDMPKSPAKAILDKTRRHIVIAVGIAAGVWILLATLYLRTGLLM